MQYPHSKSAQISADLELYLGPEYLQRRPGFGKSANSYYLTMDQARKLANEIFGEGQWQTETKWLDTNVEPLNSEFEAITVACVRVKLINGTYREDIGQSRCVESTKPKAIQTAETMAKADATKRALRQFGNSLGNCLYDNDFSAYLDEIIEAEETAFHNSLQAKYQ